MDQFTERLLPTPKISNSSHAIGQFYVENLFTVNCIGTISLGWPILYILLD